MFLFTFSPPYQSEFLAECLSCRFQKPRVNLFFFSVFFFCSLIEKEMFLQASSPSILCDERA